MDIYDIAGSAMTAQRLRLDVVASNLANVNTTRNAKGEVEAFRRKNVVFAPIMQDKMADQSGGVGPLAQSMGLHSGISRGADGKPVFNLYAQENVGLSGTGVGISRIADDERTPLRKVHDPSHPDADKDGYVTMPNINMVTEMVDMISATRAYEANVQSMTAAKSMSKAALDI